MGDGVQRKFALIVNGDPQEERHLQNVERAIQTLKAEDPGYEIAVASPKQPSGSVTSYLPPNQENLKSLITGLKQKSDDDDLLVVYVTGHGGEGKQKEGCTQLPDECLSNHWLNNELKSVPYGKRIIIMDDCYSGGAVPLFANYKTLMVTAGSPGEVVSCQNFSPYLWDEKGTDFDQDGVVTLAERYRYAIQKGKPLTFSNYFSPMAPLSFSGLVEKKPPFKPEVLTVTNGEQLKKVLKRLEPDQLALVTFSADWCEPCKQYLPVFEGLAKNFGGQYLMIHAEGIKGREKDWGAYGIREFPAAAFFDSRGGMLQVHSSYLKNPKEYLMMFPVFDISKELRLKHIMEVFGNTPFMKDLNKALYNPKPEANSEIVALFRFPPMDDLNFLLFYLSNLLKNNSPFIKSRAAFALGQLGLHANPILEEFDPLLVDPNPKVRVEAITAILKIDKPWESSTTEFRIGNTTITSKIIFTRIHPLGPLKEKIERLRRDKNSEIRYQATEAMVLALDKADKDYPGKVVAQYLELLYDPDQKNQIRGLTFVLKNMSYWILYFDEKKTGQIVQTIAGLIRKNPFLAPQLADLLIVTSPMEFSMYTPLAVMILGKTGDSSPAVMERVRVAEQKAHPENRKMIAELLEILDREKVRGHYFGFAATPGYSWNSPDQIQIGAHVSHSYRWNRLFEWKTQAGMSWIKTPTTSESDYRIEFSTGPAFHWPTPFSNSRLDPYLSAQVGFFHHFNEPLSGVSLTPGIGLQYPLSQRLLLDGAGQMVFDVPFSGPPNLGVRIPIGMTYHFE